MKIQHKKVNGAVREQLILDAADIVELLKSDNEFSRAFDAELKKAIEEKEAEEMEINS